MFKRWQEDGRGATSIEYALIASLIAVVILVGVTSTGNGTNGLFARVGIAFNTYIP
ncbi:Flp family type IVb pilin [Enterovirga sp.]|jgi:Flp pilus assembly pilin Flp|uniref:Flp family type IVb pilin n=1 Tax=Enterovirga sp. TaxID=2026350 RepID=UPI0026058F6E|nr:Flp family type IVb pilin [Enterovirga sp.]MDB5592615.1 Flp/Fap pilin component [Enterovirga sp.]